MHAQQIEAVFMNDEILTGDSDNGRATPTGTGDDLLAHGVSLQHNPAFEAMGLFSTASNMQKKKKGQLLLVDDQGHGLGIGMQDDEYGLGFGGGGGGMGMGMGFFDSDEEDSEDDIFGMM